MGPLMGPLMGPFDGVLDGPLDGVLDARRDERRLYSQVIESHVYVSFDDVISLIFLYLMISLRLERMHPNTSQSVNTIRLHLDFSTHFSVF